MRLKELSEKWLADGRMRGLRTIQDMYEQAVWIVKRFDIDIEKINSEWVSSVRFRRADEPGLRGRPVASATINRYMATLSAMLHYAHRMEWINKVPHIPYIREQNERKVWLTYDQARRLLDALPRHLEPMAAYTLQTGVRRANCTGLEWSHIDMQTKRVRVPGTQFKQGVMFSYPINDEACAAIARAQERYRHPRLVFHFRGQKLINPNGKSWAKAVRECGLVPGKVHGLEEGRQLRWHDLRHTWATWHVMAGTPVHVLKELGGWSTATVVERYYHMSESFTSAYANNVTLRNVQELPHM